MGRRADSVVELLLLCPVAGLMLQMAAPPAKTPCVRRSSLAFCSIASMTSLAQKLSMLLRYKTSSRILSGVCQGQHEYELLVGERVEVRKRNVLSRAVNIYAVGLLDPSSSPCSGTTSPEHFSQMPGQPAWVQYGNWLGGESVISTRILRFAATLCRLLYSSSKIGLLAMPSTTVRHNAVFLKTLLPSQYKVRVLGVDREEVWADAA